MQSGPRADTGAKIVEEVDFRSRAARSAEAFKHAVWTLHSFWYPEALKDFTAIAEAEPDCAIAYWGVAMSHWYPLWYPPSEAALKAGSEAVAKAMAAPTKTEREKDYIAAIAAFYQDNDKLDHSTRAIAYEKAMEQVYPHFPDDQEAGVFYSLALDATQPPTDKTFANKKKAAEILNKVWQDQPNHPGVVHYLIHSDDSPQFAEAGLPRRSATPRSRLRCRMRCTCPRTSLPGSACGSNRSISNRAANAAAIAYVRKTLGPGGFDGETVHTMDYLEYAYLQTAQDGKAKAVRRRAARLSPERRRQSAHRLCCGGDPGALRARAQRLAGGRLALARRRSASRSNSSHGPRR